MELWEKIKKGLQDGFEATKEGVSLVIEKTGEMSQVAKLRIKVLGLNRKIRDNFFEIGGRLYELSKKKKDVDVFSDEKISELIKEVNTMEKEIEKTEKEIEKIKDDEEEEDKADKNK
jgi:vacuolar-type H+-ATPase subunit I/STV1